MKLRKSGRGIQRPCKFFKIILPFLLQQNTLSIPEIVAGRLNYRYPTVATLSTPLGCSWKVSISRSKNKLYFTKGWEEFIKHNSISYGFFLVFDYRGHLHFRVHIFDLSCCEIDYQHNTNKCETLHVGEIFDTKCETPSFNVVLRASNFKANYLYVPSTFAGKYLTRKSVKLEGDDGRTWQIRHTRSERTTRFGGAGLKEFMEDNHLEVGDMLTLHFLDQKDDHIMMKFFKT